MGKKSLEDDISSSSIKLPIHGKKDGTPIFNPLSGIWRGFWNQDLFVFEHLAKTSIQTRQKANRSMQKTSTICTL